MTETPYASWRKRSIRQVNRETFPKTPKTPQTTIPFLSKNQSPHAQAENATVRFQGAVRTISGIIMCVTLYHAIMADHIQIKFKMDFFPFRSHFWKNGRNETVQKCSDSKKQKEVTVKKKQRQIKKRHKEKLKKDIKRNAKIKNRHKKEKNSYFSLFCIFRVLHTATHTPISSKNHELQRVR